MTVQEILAEALNLHQGGALIEAEKRYQAVLDIEPEQADALNLLGVLSLQSRHFQQALDYLQRAINQQAKAEYYNNLGLVYRHMGRLDTAEQQFHRALEIQPDHLDSAVNLATLMHESDRTAVALALLDGLRHQGSEHPQYLFNFANFCIASGSFDRAQSSLERLLTLTPRDEAARYNYAMLLKNQGEFEAAALNFKQLFKSREKGDKARWYYSQCRLLLHDFKEGWRYYPCRFEALKIPERSVDLPAWQGEQISGQGLVVRAEQGVGDELLFASHLPLLLNRCTAIHYECDERIKPLLERSYQQVHFFDRRNNAAPAIDNIDASFQCAAGDIIRLCNPELGAAGLISPLLQVDPEKASKLALPDSEKLNIGLSYHSSGSYAAQRMPPRQFWDLLADFKAHINFVDLQSNQARSFSSPSSQLQQIDHLDLYNDLDGLAALMCNLDYVISIDNAIAHLAGNLGLPTILLLSTVHDWRWLGQSQRIPWYPATRMIRQRGQGNWHEVQTCLHREIQQILESGDTQGQV